jgi:tRNA-dihydrouridine synthase
VAGNGDIGSAEEMLLKSRDCDAVMAGRSAIRQPWIFAEAQALESGQVFPLPGLEETGLQFLELLVKYQPPEFYLSRARRFFGFFCDNLKWGNYLKTILNRENSLAGIEEAWKRYFRENGEG